MGYATIKVVFNVSTDALHDHFLRHAKLYQPRPKRASEFEVEFLSGQHCSAVWSNSTACPDMFLYPIGQQLAALWMDVRDQDGDSWDLSCYTAFHHELTHSVNPWPLDPNFIYDERAERGVNYRIEKLCKLLPQFADTIRPYLRLWRYPPDPTNPQRLIPRKGKARETDRYGYGDAYQYLDFLSCFGIDVEKPTRRVSVCV